MSQETVAAYCKTLAATVTGINAAVRGPTEPEPGAVDAPYITVRTGGDQWRRRTMGAGGQMSHRYTVSLDLVLAGGATEAAYLETARTLYPDRVRAAFAADHTLGGRCFTSDLGPTTDNFATYREQSGALPTLTILVQIEEWKAANSAAS